MVELVPNLPSAGAPEALWQQVVQDYRRLCVLQRQARHSESDHLLRTELPARILAWAEQDRADGREQARRLDEMFLQEQHHLTEVWFLQELVEQRLRAELVPALSAQIDAEVQRAMKRNASASTPSSTPSPAPVSPPAPALTTVSAAPSIPATATPCRPSRVAAGDIPSIIDLIFEHERQSGARHLAA